MKIISILKPNKLNPKWTGTFEHEGKTSVCEFASYADAMRAYLKTKQSLNDKLSTNT